MKLAAVCFAHFLWRDKKRALDAPDEKAAPRSFQKVTNLDGTFRE